MTAEPSNEGRGVLAQRILMVTLFVKASRAVSPILVQMEYKLVESGKQVKKFFIVTACVTVAPANVICLCICLSVSLLTSYLLITFGRILMKLIESL